MEFRIMRVGLVFAGLVCGLLACEGLLRWLGYSGEHERLESVFDPQFGRIRRDSWVLDFEVDPTQPTVTIRQRSFPREKSPGRTRILFIGDSGTEGAKVAPEASYPFEFERLMAARHPDSPIEVINAGAWGMSNIDEYHFFKGKLLPLEPDVVVLGLFMSNDVNLGLEHRERKLDTGGVRGALHWLRQNSALGHFLYLRALTLNGRLGWFRNEAGVEQGQVVRSRPVKGSGLGLVDSHGFHMLSYPEGETATYMKESSELVDHAFRVLDRVLVDFLALGTQYGFEFRVLVIPTPSAVAGELTLLHFPDFYADLAAKGIHLTEDQLDFDRPTERVRAICERRGIPCVDPTERMRALGMSVFFPDNEHTTVLGHQALAAELVQRFDPTAPR